MAKIDTTTQQGRKKLLEHALHESLLEGHSVTADLKVLFDKYIAGNATLEQVKQSYMKSIKSVA